jgi:hypothetical protein
LASFFAIKPKKEPIFMFFNTVQNYVKTLILSTALKNFTAMGKFNGVSADTIQRKLQSEDLSHKEMLKISQTFLKKSYLKSFSNEKDNFIC